MNNNELVEKLRPALALLKNLETGQRCADYAYAEADGFQAMTYIPEAFEALRVLPEVIEALTKANSTALLNDEGGLKQLRLLYNHSEDDTRQFTRWQMVTAINHGIGLALKGERP